MTCIIFTWEDNAEVFYLHRLSTTSSTYSRKKILFRPFHPYVCIYLQQITDHWPGRRNLTKLIFLTIYLVYHTCSVQNSLQLSTKNTLSSTVTIISTPVTSLPHHLSSNCWVHEITPSHPRRGTRLAWTWEGTKTKSNGPRRQNQNQRYHLAFFLMHSYSLAL